VFKNKDILKRSASNELSTILSIYSSSKKSYSTYFIIFSAIFFILRASPEEYSPSSKSNDKSIKSLQIDL